MKFDSYIVSETKTAATVSLANPTYCNNKKFSLKKSAFTLAETLITLTIIGIIAAMTIPTLLAKYQKHTYVVGLKKAYSQLSNAVRMIPLTEGCSAGDYECAGFRNSQDTDAEFRLLAKQFKTQKTCLYDDQANCEWIAMLHDEAMDNNIQDRPVAGFMTQDGMTFGLHWSTITADINGMKGPNKMGRDIFVFTWNEPDYIVKPYGADLSKEELETQCQISASAGSNMSYCTARVLREDAMNY